MVAETWKYTGKQNMLTYGYPFTFSIITGYGVIRVCPIIPPLFYARGIKIDNECQHFILALQEMLQCLS